MRKLLRSGAGRQALRHKRISQGILSMLVLVMLMMTALAPAVAEADWLSGLLTGYGLSDADVEAFSALIAEVGADMTQVDVEALLKEFLGDAAAASSPGKLEGDLFTSPSGFTMRVPEGWNLLEDSLGTSAVITGPTDETGFMPTITVVVLEEAQAAFDTNTKEDWDALLGTALTNYQSIVLDDFPFLDVPAHEFVCMHGDANDAMLMQYQLYFNKGGKAFVITMTTLAEEAAHDRALEAYDKFLADFSVQGPGGQG